MQNKISEINYHIRNLDKKEQDYISSVYISLLNEYSDLKEKIDDILKDAKFVITESFLTNVLTGFLHSLKDEVLTEDQLFKKLRDYYITYLPIIVDNTREVTSSYFINYEPKVVIMLNFVNYVLRKFALEFYKNVKANKITQFDRYFYGDFIALMRAIRSAIVLFSIGDDIHAIGLFRGSVELMSNLILAKRFSKDYSKFKTYNVYLQEYKMDKTPLPRDMTAELGFNSKNENYIKYGWAKNNNGNRVTTMADFIDQAFGKSKKVDDLIHLASEFVHEDYSGIGYDYISLRKQFLDMFYEITKSSLELVGEDKKNIKKYKDMFTNFQQHKL